MPPSNLNSLQPYELSFLLTIINGKITNISAFLTDTFNFKIFIFHMLQAKLIQLRTMAVVFGINYCGTLALLSIWKKLQNKEQC